MDWTPVYTITPQRIVCSAIMHKDGAIITGIRHFDAIMHTTLELRKQINPEEDWHGCDQGFVDQFGNFLNRTQSWVIASRNNQIYRLVGGQAKEDLQKSDVQLYSENLY